VTLTQAKQKQMFVVQSCDSLMLMFHRQALTLQSDRQQSNQSTQPALQHPLQTKA
jgi:hypothetical protein